MHKCVQVESPRLHEITSPIPTAKHHPLTLRLAGSYLFLFNLHLTFPTYPRILSLQLAPTSKRYPVALEVTTSGKQLYKVFAVYSGMTHLEGLEDEGTTYNVSPQIGASDPTACCDMCAKWI